MKWLVFFVCLFFNKLSFAQNQLFLTTSAGWKISYNQLISDKTLPIGAVRATRFSGFSSTIGFEYKFSPHWATHLQVKTASVEMGIRTKSLWLDTVSGEYFRNPGKGNGEINSHAPAHIQIGASYYSIPKRSQNLSWFLGGGISYLIITNGFAPGINIGVAQYKKNGSSYYYPGKHMLLDMEEEYRKPYGVLINFHIGLDYQFAPNHHLLLTLQQNEGIKTIKQYKSNYFTYLNVKPDQTITYEHFDVKLRTKGSYTALQLGYKYAITGRKKS